MAITVNAVRPNSPAARLGLAQGCELLAVDGHELSDALDYQYYTAADTFTLQCKIRGVPRTLQVQKRAYEPFGCDFKTYLADAQHSCQNHCLFCFIDQLPKGMRSSLYFKDDDERLSFLYGNYITLTNLTQREVARIIELHISPIYVSVHTTDPDLRVRMLANKRAGESLEYLRRFAEAGIRLHCQIVLCRGINDGQALRRTLDDLLRLQPRVESIAVVPVGLTAYREGLYPLRPYDAGTAAETLEILEGYSRRCRAACGRGIVYPSDEWYLLAHKAIPPAEFYDDFAQIEDGVGMWRLFQDTFFAQLSESAKRCKLVLPHRADTVTGTMAAPLIKAAASAVMRRFPQVKITVHAIRNDFFGGNVSVAGLVTGQDILKQCDGKLKSDTLLVPDVMLRDGTDRFLDDISLAELASKLHCRAYAIPIGGKETCTAFLQARLGPHFFTKRSEKNHA